MGDVRLNTFQTILVYLLTPILLLAWVVLTLFFTFIHAFRWLFRFLTDKASGDSPEVTVTEQIADPITSTHQKLYKYARLGDTHRFSTTLADLSKNSDDIVKALSHTTPQNNTYLHIAAALQSEALAMKIVELHPLLLFRQNDERDSPLHIAAKEGKKKVVDALLAKEREIRRYDANDVGIEGQLITTSVENGYYPFLHNIRNNHDNTPLLEALINGHVPVARKLMETEPRVTNWFQLVNKEDKSALYIAVEAGFVELVKIMKSVAINLNDKVCVGKSPLQAAILGRNKEMLKILSSIRLNIIQPVDEEDKTPLHYAASTGYLKGVRFLLSQSTVDAYQKNQSGVFPIHTAASKGYVRIIQEFLEHCSDSAELLTTSGQNVLHVAAKCGRDNVVSYALKNSMLRMLVNQQDNNEDTPLHLAAKFIHPMVASTLTWDKRINLKLVNNQRFTALDIVEGNTNTITSFCGRLTWIALKSGGVRRAQDLHVLKKRETTHSRMTMPNSQSPNFHQTPQSVSPDSDQSPQSSSPDSNQTPQSPILQTPHSPNLIQIQQPSSSNLDQIPQSSNLDQIPQSSNLDQIPKSSNLDQIPQSSNLDQIPQSSNLDQIPQSSNLDQIPKSSNLDQIPQSSNLDQIPQSSNLDQIPQSSNLDQIPQSSNLDQMVGFHLAVGSKFSDFDTLKERVNTLLLVTILVATVTFAAGFTVPGGYNSSDLKSQGMATMLEKVSFQIFVICDSMAMYCSIIVAVTLMWAQLGDLNLVLSALGLALPLLGIALTMMSAAFTAGIYVVVSNVHWLAGVVLGIGGLFITIVMSLFVPLFFPSQSTNLIVRYVTYYPFHLAVLASGKYTKEVEE